MAVVARHKKVVECASWYHAPVAAFALTMMHATVYRKMKTALKSAELHCRCAVVPFHKRQATPRGNRNMHVLPLQKRFY